MRGVGDREAILREALVRRVDQLAEIAKNDLACFLVVRYLGEESGRDQVMALGKKCKRRGEGPPPPKQQATKRKKR